MKLLSKDLLSEYGFKENSNKPDQVGAAMTKDNFNVVVHTDGVCFYSNTGIDYPLKDLAALKKLYKEVKREELNKS